MATEIHSYITHEDDLRKVIEDLKMKERAVTAEKNSFTKKKITFKTLVSDITRDLTELMAKKNDINEVKVITLQLDILIYLARTRFHVSQIP